MSDPRRAHRERWPESAAALLAEADPGPTPFLVESLIVEGAIAAIVGAPKVGKTWLTLDIALALATGLPVLERFAVNTPGPVLLVLEESGRIALRRRLEDLLAGRGASREGMGNLHFFANARVRLNDPEWQRDLLRIVTTLKPSAVLLDPLVRLKGAEVDESSQREIGPVLDLIRDLRDAGETTVAYTAHTGHTGTHQRGSSDLEAYWETKLTLKEGKYQQIQLTAEHREAPNEEPITYQRIADPKTGAIRLCAPSRTLREKVQRAVRETPFTDTRTLAKTVGHRKQDVERELNALATAGIIRRTRSRPPDQGGPARTKTVWEPVAQDRSEVPQGGREPGPGLPGPTLPGSNGPKGDRVPRQEALPWD